MRAADAPLGAADCERLGDGWVAQPVNAGSSALLAVAGLWLVVRALRVRGGPPARWAAAAYGAATIVAGLGSVDYHGVQSDAAQWTHDGGAALLVAAAAAVPVLRRVRGRPALPGWTVGRGAGLVAVGAVALLAYWGGRTVGPLCSPTSVVQLHSVWHLAIGGAAAVWAVVLWPADPAVLPRPERSWSDHRLLRRLVRAVCALVYRRIDSDDLEDLRDGPVVLVANHFGGLADALVLMAALPRRPRILADDAIWRVPVARWVMDAIGAVPVHRGRGGATGNDDMFAATATALRDGELVLIFPEGVTREEPSIGRVRSGAARIALGAGVPVRVVAVGLHYADRAALRSDVAVRRGATIHVTPDAAGRPDEVDALTGCIGEELRRAAPDYTDWDEVAALRRAAEVVLWTLDPATPVDIGERERLASAYAALPAPLPAQLCEAVRSAAADGADRAVRARRGTLWVVLATVAAVAALPYALVGLALLGVPLLLALAASKLPLSAPLRATIVPVVATSGIAAASVVASVAAWRDGGWRAVGVAWALLPISAAALVFVTERIALAVREVVGTVAHPPTSRRRRARADLVERIAGLTGIALPGAGEGT